MWTWTAAGRHRAWAPPPPSFPPGASSVRDSREERWEAPRRTEGSGPVGAQTAVCVRSRWALAGASRWTREAGGVRARLTRRGARRSGAGLCNPGKASRERLERRSSLPLPGGVQDFLASVFSALHPNTHAAYTHVCEGLEGVGCPRACPLGLNLTAAPGIPTAPGNCRLGREEAPERNERRQGAL